MPSQRIGLDAVQRGLPVERDLCLGGGADEQEKRNASFDLGVILITIFPQLLLAGIFLFGLTTLFTVVTLPVEFDASARALAWIKDKNIAVGEEYDMAKDGLKWAASTYVIAALQSIATLAYYVMLYVGRSRD